MHAGFFRTHCRFIGIVVLAGTGAAAFAEPPKKPRTSPALRGRVLCADGHPVSGASVALVMQEKGFLQIQHRGRVTAWSNETILFSLFGAGSNNRTSATKTTNERGEFVVRRIKRGTYQLAIGHATHGWYVQQDLRIPQADHDPEKGNAFVEFKLTPGTTFKVIRSATPDKSRSAFLAVEPIQRSAADSKPAMWCPSIPLGKKGGTWGPLPANQRYRVALSSSTAAAERKDQVVLRSLAIEAKPGVTVTLDFTPRSQRRITGRLTDRNGKPLSDVTVHLTLDAADDTKMGAFTDKDGRFTLIDPPIGRRRLAFLRHEPMPG